MNIVWAIALWTNLIMLGLRGVTELDVSSRVVHAPGSSVDISIRSSMQISIHRLNRRNFLVLVHKIGNWWAWKTRVFDLRNKETKKEDPMSTTWRSESSIATTQLLNLMEVSLAKPHMFMKTTKKVWESVHEIYTDMVNCSQIF